MQSLLTIINVLIKQAEIMPKTGSLAQARIVCGLREMREISMRDIAAAHVGEVVA